ncbi:MAG: LacI family DNA-binding transcriptional regulator [Verrucomicrobia bacterium]|nr:LacI family DNA-binding transcriptional regulator [Verrucomicrobiota bacterium]MDA1006057.1 LacI family DNA-binding transcriptional regulator [Verrucomicrobiota bacterium]
MARKQIRLKDVAEKAGVAVNTASTILNRRPNSWASKATEERVFAAAKSLGYRPNRAAVALQSGRFHTIGLLIADMHNPYFTHFAAVLGKTVEARGYNLIIENWRTDLVREKKLLEDFVHRNVDGVAAFMSDVDEHREFLETQGKLGFPMVALAMPTAGAVPVDMVVPNFETGLREAAGTLYELGHRRFSFLSARSKGQRVGKRPAIFQAIIGELPGSEVEVVECGPSVEEAREVAQRILVGPNRPTAVVALNDYTAIGVMRAAKDLKLSVPEDLSVVGIDGVPLANHLTVSLSTVAQPHEDMVAKTVELLLARIESEGEDELPPQRVEFATRFILRESVGPVR